MRTLAYSYRPIGMSETDRGTLSLQVSLRVRGRSTTFYVERNDRDGITDSGTLTPLEKLSGRDNNLLVSFEDWVGG